MRLSVMPNVVSATHLLALLGILLGAVSQSATGMGFSLISAPLMVVYLGPREGVAATVVLAALSSVVPLVRYRRHARPAEVTWLLVPMLVCTPLVALALARVDTRWLALAAGAGVIISAGALAFGVRWRWLRRPQAAVATGAASALLNVVGGVGGPPIGLYAANADWPPSTVRANLHSYFVVQNVVTATILGIVLPGVVELAALVTGTAGGLLLAPRMPATVLRMAILGASLLGGVVLVGTAI